MTLLTQTRKSIEVGLLTIAVGGAYHEKQDGHVFLFVRTCDEGIHSGRPRFLVACETCFELIHEGTTGPVERVEQHLDPSRPVNQAYQLGQLRARVQEPVPMRLHCPECKMLHIDDGEFATKPHHTHACQSCGNVWRPALVATVGVRFLPGFKNE